MFNIFLEFRLTVYINCFGFVLRIEWDGCGLVNKGGTFLILMYVSFGLLIHNNTYTPGTSLKSKNYVMFFFFILDSKVTL